MNRDEGTPLAVDILTALPLPIAVDEAAPFEAFEPSAGEIMAVRGLRVLDTSARGAWNVVSAICPDLFPSPDAARKGLSRSRGQNPIYTLYGLRPREGFARVRLPEARYAPPVRVSASSAVEARELVAERLPDASVIEYEPPKLPGFELWAAIRHDVLRTVRTQGEAAADERLRAILSEVLATTGPTEHAAFTLKWWREGLWRDHAEPIS